MRDLHQSVIDCDTEIVDRHSIASHNDKVTKCVCIPRHISTDAVSYPHQLILFQSQIMQSPTTCRALWGHGNDSNTDDPPPSSLSPPLQMLSPICHYSWKWVTRIIGLYTAYRYTGGSFFSSASFRILVHPQILTTRRACKTYSASSSSVQKQGYALFCCTSFSTYSL